MVYTKKPDRNDRLARRTVQIVGFTFAIFLTIYKLVSPDSDIPWWVVFGFFGFGVSADFDINAFLGRK